MKVAFVIRSLNNTGPILITKSLVDYLVTCGIKCKVFYFKNQVELDFLCPTKQIEFKKFENELNEYDIVHSHNLVPDIYVWRYRKKISGKVLTTKHEYSFDNLRYRYNILIAIAVTPIYDFVLNKLDVVVCLTNHMREYYQKRLNTKVVYIYNGISLNKNLNPIDIHDIETIKNFKANGKILIMTICILTKGKGVHQLMYALAKNKDLILVIIGDGKERKVLEKLADCLNVTQQVLFLGYKFEALRYLALADIFALCSYSEGFPVAIMEAGVYSVPVVCSDIPILKEIYGSNEVSFFKLDNIDSLLNAINIAFNNKEKLSINLHSKVVSKYSLEHMGESYVNLYQQLIENKFG